MFNDKQPQSQMNLYWVTTEDHHEDWFIVAASAAKASMFHEREEGYDKGDAKAVKILDIPTHIEVIQGWPSEQQLLALGANFIRNETPRVVEINGAKFSEGMLEYLIVQVDKGIRDNDVKN